MLLFFKEYGAALRGLLRSPSRLRILLLLGDRAISAWYEHIISPNLTTAGGPKLQDSVVW